MIINGTGRQRRRGAIEIRLVKLSSCPLASLDAFIVDGYAYQNQPIGAPNASITVIVLIQNRFCEARHFPYKSRTLVRVE